jgi:alpha-mannosidase
MHRDPVGVRRRLDRFVTESLTPAVHADARPLRLDRWDLEGEPVPFAAAAAAVYTSMKVGDAWGPAWGTTWLRVEVAIPSGWTADERLRPELVFDLGFNGIAPGFQAEGLVFREDGTTVKAISPLNASVPLEPTAGGRYLFVELAANPTIAPGGDWTPITVGDRLTASAEPRYRIARADIALRDTTVWELLQDVTVLAELEATLPPNSPRAAQILLALERVLDATDPDQVARDAEAARAILAPALAAPAVASAPTVIATGHAHIDAAWLWPLRETIRKCARTFSNVLALMDADPEFIFACSSAQQFAWMKEHYPDLYERIRTRVAEGRFVPVGGQWIEPDTNMPGGESTARQIIEGKRFFLEEFGIDTEEIWLPDTFGYSGSLPQIIAASGSRWFMSQKISWNQTNRFPHHTFWWEGIDGTRVFTHFPPVDSYNARISGEELARAEHEFRENGGASVSLVPFGYGDGGGGPTAEMLAAARRNRSLDGAPRVELGSPATFFERAFAEYPDAPVWAGEMYLELHRGTLTSQHAMKSGNRRSEHLLREAEYWSAAAAVRAGAAYPYQALRGIWQRVLLLQFHDILPGSSIAWVHREARDDYAKIALELEGIIQSALGALAGSGDRELRANARPHLADGVEPLGVGAPERGDPARCTRRDDGSWLLENDALRVVIDEHAALASLVDLRTGRDAVPPGMRAAVLRLYRDLPSQWDAWDIDENYRRAPVEGGTSTVLGGGVEDGAAVLRARHDIGGSTVNLTFRLDGGGRALDVGLHVDWQERHRLLKLVFPVDVRAEVSTSEIQFGHIQRPTHRNTSWDHARFEFAAQRWIHVGEPSWGVAIANDSSYGHDVTVEQRDGGGTATVVGISVLRAPTFPDPQADVGEHTLNYAIRPGAGIQDAITEGYRLNLPMRTIRGRDDVVPLVRSTGESAIIETVKLADDGSGDLVVRMYESLGVRSSTTVTVDAPVTSVKFVDLMERAVGTPDAGGPGSEAVRIDLRPFQLVTLRFALAAE